MKAPMVAKKTESFLWDTSSRYACLLIFLFCEMVKNLALTFFKFLPKGMVKSSSRSPTNCASCSRIVRLPELPSLS